MNKKAINTDTILQISFELFSKKGIDNVVMTDVAKETKIGVASLYRYFNTKEELAVHCAVYSWQTRKDFFITKIETEDYKNKSGLEQMRQIFSMFLELFEDHHDFFRFIYYFDSYVKRLDITKEKLNQYERNIVLVQEIIVNALKKGKKDKSIKESVFKKYSYSELYFTIMHSLFSLAQKLSLSEDMLYMNQTVTSSFQIKLLSDMLIDFLGGTKNEKSN